VGSSGILVTRSRVVNLEWQVSYYEEFASLLFPNDEAHPLIIELIKTTQALNLGAGLRREIVIHEFPFLCAIRPEEKALYIGTRKLSRELSLLKIYEVSPIMGQDEDEKFLYALKNHVEKISTLSPVQFPSEIEWVTAQNQLAPFWNKDQWQDVDDHAKGILKELISKVGEYRSSSFEKFSDYGLSLTAQFDLIRVHLLKFLALLPSLDHDKSGAEVKRNLLESLRRLNDDSRSLSQKPGKAKPLPFYLNILFTLGLSVAALVPAALLARIVRYMVRMMAKRFIAGESISTSTKTLRDLRESKRQATLDQLGELVVSAREADEYFEKVLQLIHGLKQHIPRGEKNSAGILNAHVSIKVSALSHDFRPQAFEATYAKVAPRLRRILQEAVREEVFINVDAEHYHYRDLVLKIFAKVLLETPELKDFAQTGIVVQAYLRDGSKHLMDVAQLAKQRGLRMPIRLVKGAYWDAETIEGEAHQFTPPQFLNKEESDLHFRQLAYLALKNHEQIHLAIGSHNLQDHAFVESVRTLRFPKAPVIEHQCLHMTYEALSHGLAKMNWPTRNYMPIGNLLVGMAYLVRRIMENSSQVGVLSIMRSHQKASGLISPVDVLISKKKAGTLVFDSFITQLRSDFSPVRPLRLFLDDEREDLMGKMSSYRADLDKNQSALASSKDEKVICSSKPELLLGTYKLSTPAEAKAAVEKAHSALSTDLWGKPNHALNRVSVMLKAADLMLLRRNELSAIMIYEAGKTMTEALADVDEAIDFINFYARQEIKLQISGEKLTNRGVITVIAPWNFPLAIPCGMTVAPLVAGNAVILKPAEQTPLIGAALFDILIEAGVPTAMLTLIQGDGEQVGAPMVSHPLCAGVVFTGSKNVGQWIYKEAGSKLIEHHHLHRQMQKKIITEMGGKNAVIVTNNCELDETISGILYAAFGHAGQKCSAASRVIVHKEVKDAFTARLVGAIQDLKVGESFDPATAVNPLITEADQARVRKCIEGARDEAIRVQGKILIDRSFEKLPGFCVGPAVFEIPAHQATKKDSWAQKEIFGPVIHVISYESLMDAVELFNGTEYALTGGIYSQSQDDIDFLIKYLKAGNLYVNRPNTGARVAIEPFGGFKLSGTGPKAGGVDYLKEFHYPVIQQAVAELKEGFAQDSGYKLTHPKPSLISLSGRTARFSQFAHQLLDQYETLMGAVNERDKGQLNGFTKWVEENLSVYLNGQHLNYVIPGQMSYNDKSMIKTSGLFVTVLDKPSHKAVLYFMGAMALGTGISIVCLTEGAYRTWKGIVDIAWKAGFTKMNLDITLASKEALQDYLKDPKYSFIFAGAFTEVSDVYENVLNPQALSETMRLILSDVDGVSFFEPAHVLDQFVWTRSMAVNTMRHGAPLELSST
jgi:RHH-type proline utilization regulon transcriptional repressor/proline dehydrogenase/delta 1-pyrroline-5-carboxylate dehydrogenase